jgi:hypothetical protein
MICVEDPIILFSDVVDRLPVYWQEFARYHAEIGNIVITDSEKQKA